MKPNRFAIGVVIGIAVAVVARAQDLTPRSSLPKGPVVIVDATIHPVSGPVIEHGSIAFDGGRITDVGTFAPPKGATVIDGKGRHVYPGFVGAVTQLGLTEIGSIRASKDFAEVGEITPEVRAAVAVNPDSTLFPVTRANGVLSVGVFPSGGVIPGRASVIQLEGWTHEDMTVLGDAGVVLNWPGSRGGRGRFGGGAERSEEDQNREANAAVTRIEDFFTAAEAYVRGKAADPSIPTDIRLEAMRKVLSCAPGGSEKSGQARVFVNAQEYDQIMAAVGFAKRHALSPVIVGGRDAPLLAELLKQNGVGVIVSGTFKLPRRADAPYDDAYSLPARLEAAGVKWCLASGDETPHERNLPYAAALASAHGLKSDAALRAITLSAAELLGVDKELGSLEKGKRATLFVCDGDPLEITTKVERAFVGGREIDLSSKQTRLAEKYRAKYK